MRKAGIILLVIGALLAFGLPALESAMKWSSYGINIIKLLGWVVLAVGIFVVFKKPADEQQSQD
jgi:hypothetical protein